MADAKNDYSGYSALEWKLRLRDKTAVTNPVIADTSHHLAKERSPNSSPPISSELLLRIDVGALAH